VTSLAAACAALQGTAACAALQGTAACAALQGTAACAALQGTAACGAPQPTAGSSSPAPWLDPYRGVGRGVAERIEGGASVAQALNDALAARPIEMPQGRRLRFAPADSAPIGVAYEAHIARTASVPTRDDAHDLFNGLAWLCHPRLKRRLNELQADAIARAGIGAARGPLRDALTLFDENAALLQAPDVLVRALAANDWRTLFVTDRAAWREARLLLFGHALLEKLLQPRKAITAHVWVLAADADLHDAALAELDPARLAARPWHPLPVLGVPGWWPDNEEPGYYDDAAVFRPARQARGTQQG
jgi:hypothetical protein